MNSASVKTTATRSAGIAIHIASNASLVKESMGKLCVIEVGWVNSPTVLCKAAMIAKYVSGLDESVMWFMATFTMRAVQSLYAWHVDDAGITVCSVW